MHRITSILLEFVFIGTVSVINSFSIEPFPACQCITGKIGCVHAPKIFRAPFFLAHESRSRMSRPCQSSRPRSKYSYPCSPRRCSSLPPHCGGGRLSIDARSASSRFAYDRANFKPPTSGEATVNALSFSFCTRLMSTTDEYR